MKPQRLLGSLLLSAALLLTSIGVLAFWVHWFVSGNFMLAGDECFRVFENTFPFPDTVMAVMMFFAASALWRGQDSGVALAFFCAGMAMQLASLDLLYHLRHGGFADASDPETYSRGFIIVHCFGLSAVLIIYYWRRRRLLLSAALDDYTARMRFPVGMITVALLNGSYGVLTMIHWVLHFFNTGAPADSCGEYYHDAFLLADSVTVLAALLTTVGIFLRKSWALVWGLLSAGGITFGACIWAAYAITNPELIEGRVTTYFIFLSFLLTGTIAFSAFLWSRRAWFLSLDKV